MKLLIRKLARDTTEAELQDMFESYGIVQSCDLVLDNETGKSKGFAFIEMPRQGEAKAAMKNLNGTSVDGNIIRVKKAVSKEKEPSALKKESSTLDKEPSALKKESSTLYKKPSTFEKEPSALDKKSSTSKNEPLDSPYRKS